MILEAITSVEYQKYLDEMTSVDFLQSVQQGKKMQKLGWMQILLWKWDLQMKSYREM